MDLLGFMKQHGDLRGHQMGLHSVIAADKAKGMPPGIIFALRNVNTPDDVNRGNRLHPHYLVYLGEDGCVIADHTEAKRLLDLLRAGCRGIDHPMVDAASAFNVETRDGAAMSRYSTLLTDAIRSIIDVTDERDIDSLFTTGATTALTQGISGLEDFELIAFIAVVNPNG
jgi:hypothetical protein